MKDYLVDLIKNWNQADADRFHSNCTRDNIEGRYIWNYDDTGITIYRDITAVHISTTGKICKLTKEWKSNEWRAFSQLYNLSEDSKDFRTEIPLNNLITETGMFYCEVQRPNYEIGLDFQYDIFENNINEKYFIDYIDQTVILFRNLKKVVTSVDEIGYPEVGIPFTKRLRDEKGYFWSDFKKWNYSENQFKERMLNDLSVSIFYLENNIGKLAYKEKIKDYAIESWSML